jgi:PIN domain nuclease of toxin-antitoxin system
MTVLLDTHILLWWLADDPGLTGGAPRIIAAQDTVVFVSAATAWEIAIKRAIGKLNVPDEFEPVLEQNGFQPLPITMRHALAAGRLPRHHDDPFDRMLVAQAQSEELKLTRPAVGSVWRFRSGDVDRTGISRRRRCWRRPSHGIP